MGVQSNNVVVALAAAYIQPWSATTAAALPADTVMAGTEWTNQSWVHMGGTDQGWKLKVSTKTSEITIEEQSNPVMVLADGKSVTVSGDLAEDTLTQAKWAYGGGILTPVAAGSGTIGKTTLSLQDKLDSWAIGLDTVNKDGYFRRILIPKAIITSDVETSYRRAAEKRMYGFEAVTICPINQIQIVEMTAVAL